MVRGGADAPSRRIVRVGGGEESMNRFARTGAIALLAAVGLGANACAETTSDTSFSLAASDAAGTGAQASYSVTFAGAWTTDATPGGLPDNAHFSPLIGAVHNANVTFWRPAAWPRRASSPWRNGGAPPR